MLNAESPGCRTAQRQVQLIMFIFHSIKPALVVHRQRQNG